MVRRLFFLTIVALGLGLQASAQAPVANFSGTPTSGCGLLVTTFTDLSTNSPTSWSWNFGDGTALSSLQNPTHAYTTNGTFTVTLTATNGSGSDVETKVAYIHVYKNPIPNFTGTPVSGCAPLLVNFTSTVTLGDAPITLYQWDFGDGGTSNLQNPSHVYANPGTYSVSLTVTDANGCSKNIIKNSYITAIQKPNATFTVTNNIACAHPLTTNFTNTTVGSGLTYLWNFGDGTTSTLQNPSHTYNADGNYTVTLIVDKGGCKDTLIVPMCVQIGTFATNFTATPTSGCVGSNVSFSDTSTHEIAWDWDFGDGSTHGSVQNPGHVYNTPGTYTVTLIATNNMGCIDTVKKTNYITIYGLPNVNFTSNDSIACTVPFTVNFTNLTPNTVNWLWSFGDGTTSVLQNPSHTYTLPGQYSVALVVIDNHGCQNQIIKNYYIEIEYPVAAMNAVPRQGCIPLPVQFTNTSTSNFTITNWAWNFGDGSPISNQQNPMHVYSDSGAYTVTLIITNSEGCKDTIVMPNYITPGIHPVANFAADDTVGCHQFQVMFSDSSSDYANYWHWDFGDGGTSNLEDPQHTYADTGFFSVELIVGHNGCYDTLKKDDYIHVLPPKPQFSATPTICCYYPDTVQFTDMSQGATTWFWDFGDGGTSTLQNPSHIYMNQGFYHVKLVVTNPNGCRDSLTYMNYIRISELIPDFNSIPNPICQYQSINFNDLSYANTSVVNHFWDWGDGNTSTLGTPNHTYIDSGTYTVSLIVTDQLGCMDTIIKTDEIKVWPLPSPQFVADTTIGCTPFLVHFSDLSLPRGVGTISGWSWNFGDGTPVSNQQNPTHIYTTPGYYTVSLTVTDSKGCDSTITKSNYVKPSYPYTNFTTSLPVTCHYDSVYFINQSTGLSLSYDWDFGDGSPHSNAVNPAHLYNVSGTSTINVTLTASDQNGCDSTIVLPVTISRPIAALTSDSAQSQCPPFWVQFYDASTTDAISWLWNFNDTISGMANTSDNQNPQHVFYNAGTYDITLMITNQFGCMDTITMPDFIQVDGPVGTFSYSPIAGCIPLSVTFTSNTHNAATLMWVFGDGNIAYGDTVVYQYTQGGSFTPVLVMTDSLTGPLDSVLCTVTLTGQQPITVIDGFPGFFADTTFSCLPGTFNFTDTSTTTQTITSWTWDFGDGGVSAIQNPSHYYAAPGVYPVTLTIGVDSCDFSYTHTQYITIFDPPDILFTLSDSNGCSPLTVDFTIIDTTVTESVSSWLWDFGDGSAADTAKNPTHNYNTSGTYNVNVTTTFTNGCFDNYADPVNMTIVQTPTALYTTEQSNFYPLTPIAFIDTSLGPVTTWYWDLGDGTTGTTQDITHGYQYVGVYDILFIVSASGVCWDTLHSTFEVKERIDIPNAFTPDGDGINDVYMRGSNLIVLNRWGQVLYEGLDGWDGNYKGNEMPAGTYYYIITLEQIKDKIEKYQGPLTLIRKNE